MSLLIFIVDVFPFFFMNAQFVFLPAVILNECNFESGFCGWTSIGENDKWKLSSNKMFTKYPGRFVMNVSIY